MLSGGSMRLLVISPHYGYFIKGMVEAQAKIVDKIDVLVRHNRLAEISNYIPGSYFEYIKKYTRRNLVDLRNLPDNVEVHLVSMLYFAPDGKNKFLRDKMAREFEEFIKKKRIEFDLIHAHFTWPCGYICAQLKERFRLPLVITGHGFDVYDLPFRDPGWRRIVVHALSSADIILTVSRRNLRCIEELNVRKPIRVIPNGFDQALFHPRDSRECKRSLNIPTNKMVVLTVGNLVEVKGHRYLIEAMCNIITHEKDALCVIVGGGSLEKALMRKIREENLDDHIFLVGAKPHDEIPLWMNACDLFVIPSLSEGNPTVMFEALGCGKPVVATRVGGIPEIITSEDYGLLCNPGDPKDLAEKILIALDKKWDREKIRKYAEQFTWDNIAKQVMKVYENVLRK